jgi:alanine racemase
MEDFSYRDTWAEISIDHIKDNFMQFKQYIKDPVKIMAVVKADGYGHGAIEVAQASIEAGANYLGVAFLDEALVLRAAGISCPILILGYIPKRSVKKAIFENITMTVFNHETLDEIIAQSYELNKKACIHLKIDTGMTRIGLFSLDDALQLAKKALAYPFIQLEGIFTHFAHADSDDPTYTTLQYNRFLEVIESLLVHDIQIPIKHCCNSAATMKFPFMHLDMVRIGVALYGLYPDASLKNHPIQLKQAMSFKTRVAAVQTVPHSQPVSYGCTWLSPRKSMIATLPLGYADGLSRLLSNKGSLLTHGRTAPIAGRVCMDQTMIDVTDIENCHPGDEVTIFGYNKSSFQSVDDVANWMGTINYETVCLIGKRVPRVYLDLSKNPVTTFIDNKEFTIQ